MARTSVGVVLRQKSVDVVEARWGLRGIHILKTVSVPIQGRQETDDTQVVEAIRTALANAGVKATRVGVSIPGEDVLLRSFTMPLLPKAEWKTAVQFEARKYIPFRTEELVWNFHVTERPSAKQLAVAFVGIRAETFAQIQGWLAKAGAKPTFLEAQSVSLARLMGNAPNASSSDQFLGMVDIDVDAGVAHIVIAKNQIPYFARDVNLKLEREGLGTGPTAVDPRAEVLLSELRLSFDFFTRENPQAVIPQLVVFGDQLTINPWVRWLSEQLHCPVATGMAPLARGSTQPMNLHFACAAGLVLRELRPTKVKLDFPERRSVSRDTATRKMVSRSLFSKLDPQLVKSLAMTTAMQAAIGLVVVVGLASIRNQPVVAARHELARLLQSAPDMGWGLKEKRPAELLTLQQQVEAHLAILQKINGPRVSVTEKLDALAKLLPDGVWLEGLGYQDHLEQTGEHQQALTLRGACFLPGKGGEMEVIGGFAEQLKQDSRFFRGFQVSQLGEIGTGLAGRQVSYRTFKLNYNSKKVL